MKLASAPWSANTSISLLPFAKDVLNSDELVETGASMICQIILCFSFRASVCCVVRDFFVFRYSFINKAFVSLFYICI